jgi:uncharacterized iron-regulated membrane protein
MKLIIFLALTGLAVTGWAQAPAKPDAAKPAAEAAKPAPEAAAKPMADAPKQAAAGPRIPKQRRWTEDARHCLERPTADEVIKCAEEYL